MSNSDFIANVEEVESDVSSLSSRHTYHRMPSHSSFDFEPTFNKLPEASTPDEPRTDAERNGSEASAARPTSTNLKPIGSTPPTPSQANLTPLTSSPSHPQHASFPQTFGAAYSPGLLQTPPGSSQPLMSPRFQRFDNGRSPPNEGRGLAIMREDDELSREMATDYDDGFIRNDERLPGNFHDNDKNGLLEGCPAHKDLHSSRASWVAVSVLILSIYSTIFSAIWLVLAIVQPRYGRRIHSGGSLSPSTASTLFALFAKTIELSFVTVFITFLGQVLTRRSLVQSSRGVNIAELSMRTWVLQPGFMFTHWQHLRHAVFSFLGIITLTAALVAMFYTTASNALVSPHLKYGIAEDTILLGLVKTKYANPIYIAENCQTPISISDDPYAGTTCLAVEHAGQSYHNSLAYLATWQKISASGNGSSVLSERPQAVGILYDNTTVTGSWIETQNGDIATSFKKYNRIVNNVTLAMPHAGVFGAARDSNNGIMQPEDLAGVGEYNIRAAVVSPAINVLCVNMDYEELAPLIYVEWPDSNWTTSTDGTNQKFAWPGYELNTTQAFAKSPYLNSTVVDDIFQWGPKYGAAGRPPPVFPMAPVVFNTITNISVAQSDSNYLLIKSNATTDYTMCQIRSWLFTNCSTTYAVSGTAGGHLESNCEDPTDTMAYHLSVSSVPNPPIGEGDYRNVASEWLLSTSLNTGITNANASSARLLSRFVVANQTSLNPLRPSLAETLAVMGGSTLLLSSIDSSFHHFWNFTNTTLEPGEYVPFNASLASQQYSSGFTARWQGMFYVPLLLVFATNVFCLIYFLLRAGIVTDYTEPQNLFALAVNSPPSSRLHGSCGAGPEGEMLNVDWHVGKDEGSNHFYFKERQNGMQVEGMKMRRRQSKNSSQGESQYYKLAGRKTPRL